MAFFTKKQKNMALEKGYFIEREYEISEKELLNVALTGDENKLEKAMAKHHDIEYAMLFTRTPEYRNIIRQSFQKKK